MITACRPAPERTEATADDYAVYSAYLNKFEFYGNVPRSDTVIIRDATSMRPTDINAGTPWSWVAAIRDQCRYENDTARCHQARNKVWEPLFTEIKEMAHRTGHKLEPAFSSDHPVQMAAPHKLKQFEERDSDSVVRS